MKLGEIEVEDFRRKVAPMPKKKEYGVVITLPKSWAGREVIIGLLKKGFKVEGDKDGNKSD